MAEGWFKNDSLIHGKLASTVSNHKASIKDEHFEDMYPNPEIVYTGDLNGYKAEGYGTLYRENGDVYEGYFKDWLATGYGVYHFASGEKLVGYNAESHFRCFSDWYGNVTFSNGTS